MYFICMNYYLKIFLVILINLGLFASNPKAGSFSITRIQYSGGGDWYADPSSIPNLLEFISKNTTVETVENEYRAKIGSDEFYNGFFLYMTGHGNISLSDKEAQELRNFLLDGGFLFADDNYGMDKAFRREMKKVFPDKDWVELPSTHPIFSIYFTFENGLPKIHEHNNQRPQAFALFSDDKIIALYTFESDLGDGWEDQSVHNNPQEKRLEALKMGTNIILYSLLR